MGHFIFQYTGTYGPVCYILKLPMLILRGHFHGEGILLNSLLEVTPRQVISKQSP